LFINTLPIRIRISEATVREGALRTHLLLTELVSHEHARLAMAQRCSKVAAPAPLFTAILNYHHGADAAELRSWEGVKVLGVEERSPYPLFLDVDDRGDGF